MKDEMQELAKNHLWLHFSRMGSYKDKDIPIMSHGEGCYIYDTTGKKYFDGLSGLFVTQVGHGRAELAEAGAEQMKKLAYYPVWTAGNESAVKLAGRLASLAPSDLNRVFFTNSGSEAVESAWKLARQYFATIGQNKRTKVISRYMAYHGVTMGALSINGIPGIREPFAPLVPGVARVENTNCYRCSFDACKSSCNMLCASDIERAILREGPETVAAVFLEPMQNSGGCLVPPEGYWQEVRRICDKYGVLLVSDEVICAFGRLGHMFGCQKYDYIPDIITSAKGITSGYMPLGAMICRDFLIEPFLEDPNSFLHGLTFGGHPASCAVALANLDIMEREDLPGNVLRNEEYFREQLATLRSISIVGDTRGDGYFHAIELVKDQATKELFPTDVCDELLVNLNAKLDDHGLICRAAECLGSPIIQLSPPLISGPEELDYIVATLTQILGEINEMYA